ncbi:peptidoglycan-binding protein [Pseudoruegeria sp. HB172150]|uniref:peptidoglycan-binding domain-containing protein n=1 Tax=Pseudoruegeria sp. HB172150 TaxID=2721164 RepID=UPI001553CCA9|nr:peptidoglycan-binding domain-containing protein [Pseudoruegeria sp. HB172150]
MLEIRKILAIWVVTGVAACGADTPGAASRMDDHGSIPTFAQEPSGPTGTCHAQDTPPTRRQTVTEDVMVIPAETEADGTVINPPVYRKETVEKPVETRLPHWFESVCSDQFTPEFIASLQRALAARGAFSGPDDGEMTQDTRDAIRTTQAARGVDSEVLSLALAREFGLVPTPLDSN